MSTTLSGESVPTVEPAGPRRVLVYAPHSFNGRGPAESCSCIVPGFAPAFAPEIFAPRFRRRIPGPVRPRPSLPAPLRHVPWRLVADRAISKLQVNFERALDSAEPGRTVAYFWPDSPVELVENARSRGILTVREMINTACATSVPILDEAYSRLSLPPPPPITAHKIEVEKRELRSYDFYFASNPHVEASLLALGVDPGRILCTTFGWTPSRLRAPSGARRSVRPRLLFVGTLSVRKGIPDLLAAWREADVDADLILAGTPAPEIADLVRDHAGSGNVQAVGYVKDVGALFHSADVFVFPTLEEGGPQVTYEAAGCGLPVITTPMGAARLVETGVNGIVVQPGSVTDLAEAIKLMVTRDELRAEYGANARRKAADFTYSKVGAQRRDLVLDALARRDSFRSGLG
jgi:glycosyltransferase involved in cell wall biosynthesis